MENRHYPLAGKYLRWARAGLEAAKRGQQVKINWCTVVDFKEEFIGALHRRISKKGGTEPRGRKTDSDYLAGLRRDQRRLHEILNSRIRHYQFETADVRGRFNHLLSSYDD
jgi:hypothetical protein